MLLFDFQVIINIPRGNMPQGIKYFTIIGPSTDCMDEKYNVSYINFTFLLKIKI